MSILFSDIVILQQHCQTLPFRGCFLHCDEVEETKRVLVLSEVLIDKNSLTSYFSAKGRSEGGPVSDVDICLNPNGFIVTFEEASGWFLSMLLCIYSMSGEMQYFTSFLLSKW